MTYQKCNAITVRLPDADLDGVKECVRNGYGLNAADFVRLAIREKIARCAPTGVSA